MPKFQMWSVYASVCIFFTPRLANQMMIVLTSKYTMQEDLFLWEDCFSAAFHSVQKKALPIILYSFQSECKSKFCEGGLSGKGKIPYGVLAIMDVIRHHPGQVDSDHLTSPRFERSVLSATIFFDWNYSRVWRCMKAKVQPRVTHAQWQTRVPSTRFCLTPDLAHTLAGCFMGASVKAWKKCWCRYQTSTQSCTHPTFPVWQDRSKAARLSPHLCLATTVMPPL